MYVLAGGVTSSNYKFQDGVNVMKLRNGALSKSNTPQCVDKVHFLLLISNEVARREQKKFSTRSRRAQFRETKTQLQ